MKRKDALARLRIGRRHEDDSVESARTLHRLVDIPRSVRRGEDEDVLVVGADRVELLQQLVDQGTPGTARVLAPGKRDRVKLVEKENARSEPARLHERVMQIALADAEVRIEDLLDPDVRER